MVGCGCDVCVENDITVTALSRRIDGVEGVTWYGAGAVIMT